MADKVEDATVAAEAPAAEAPAADAAAPAAAEGGEAAPAEGAAPAAAEGAAEEPGFASASLYVGDLHPDVTEAQLFEVFSPFGPVASIRVCRDAVTRRSLGYAYCNYHDQDSAAKALKDVNGQPVKGKPCRVMWSQRDPSTRKSGKGNIFIKNLDKSITQKQLLETFEQFGKIVSCKIETDEKGDSKGYGYIQFEEDEAASDAVTQVNGMEIKGKNVYVGPFKARKEREMDGGAIRFTNVYVKNLPADFTQEKLVELFSKYGEVTSPLLATNEDGSLKGFAFVNFSDPEHAAAAVAGLNGHELDGRELFVSRAQKKYEREAELRSQFEQRRQERLSKYEGVNLYVKNLEDDVDDDKLREMFDEFGTITSSKVMRDQKTQASRGFGFVCFSTQEEATRAVTTMNGKIYGTKPMYVALAQPREIRRRQLEMQFAQRQIAAAAAAAGGVLPGGPGGVGPMARGPIPGFPGGPLGPGGFPMGMPGAAGIRPAAGFGAFPQPGVAPPAAMFYGGNQWPGGPGGMAGPGGMPGGPQGGAGGRGGYPNGGRGGGRGGRGGRGGGRGGAHQQQGMPPMDMVAAAAAAQQQAAAMQAAQAAQPAPGGGGQLTLQFLADFPVKEQHRLIGERLYPLIRTTQPELAGKITGMILESCTTEEMLQLIDDHVTLSAKVDEALEVLHEHAKESEQ